MGITKKQKAVYDYICDYSRDNGCAPTQKEIKEHFGLKSFGSVQRYIKYLANAGYLEADWNARRGLKIADNDEFDSPPAQSNSSETEIPLLGLVAAGNPIEALENPTEYISVPNNMVRGSDRFFALTVRGDSMIEDGIFENDVIICRYTQTAYQGQTVVAVVDGDATVKNYFRRPNHIELHPANSSMSPIVIDSGDFKIAGALVGLLRFYA